MQEKGVKEKRTLFCPWTLPRECPPKFCFLHMHSAVFSLYFREMNIPDDHQPPWVLTLMAWHLYFSSEMFFSHKHEVIFQVVLLQPSSKVKTTEKRIEFLLVCSLVLRYWGANCLSFPFLQKMLIEKHMVKLRLHSQDLLVIPLK